MSVINCEELLQETSPDAPAGENLEYDAAFGEMERAAQGKSEQQFGETIVPGEEPDWRDLKRKALEVLSRSKDLRAAVYLTRAVLRTDGWSGFSDCIALLRGYVENYWESFYPQLDPDDDNDPTMRVNTLVTLCDGDAVLRPLARVPLVSSRNVGRFGLHDIALVSGEVPPTAGETPPESSTIEAAFADAEVEQLQVDAYAVRAALDNVEALEKALTERVGVGNSASFKTLSDVLRRADKVLTEQLLRRGVGVEAEAAEEGEGGVAGERQRLSGEITSREDVILAIDKICSYYDRYEPSSPLPLLLKRAKRLVTKNFLEIIKDLTPDALGQAQAIGGIVEGEEGY